VALLLALVACGPAPGLAGRVVDIWGNPVEGATVRLAGHSEQPLTDREGRYRLPLFVGPREVRVGRQGYVQDRREVTGDGRPGEAPLFELYPMPEHYGLYLVNAGTYARLPETRVAEIGASGALLRGVRSTGDVVADSSRLRVVFHTPLKVEEIGRLDLELHRLAYVKDAEIMGAIAPVRAAVNLWVSDGEIPLEVTPLRSRTDNLVTAADALPPGMYALQTQGLLARGDDRRAFALPEELRVVFPFEVR
jgi:hypothetical protein